MNYCAGSNGISMAQIWSTLVMIVGPAGGKLRYELIKKVINFLKIQLLFFLTVW